MRHVFAIIGGGPERARRDERCDMFYMGGMTLGYLTPNQPAPCKVQGVMERETGSEEREEASKVRLTLNSAGAKKRPVHWPLHIFY
ncbi:hypothetical protein [Sinorhizobium sp. BG8]|uniref:hypothetical protein n=1 Tax=Sinorhizobium sp. BG8 TaxID=2613773 RepID=UPI00193EBBA1|nr:hypothetical protein [Sinorhizobium sp. BG8]QRM53702.1 hypothetical protein F3Y30_03360 [Sinorhizobium sp. BG8]